MNAGVATSIINWARDTPPCTGPADYAGPRTRDSCLEDELGQQSIMGVVMSTWHKRTLALWSRLPLGASLWATPLIFLILLAFFVYATQRVISYELAVFLLSAPVGSCTYLLLSWLRRQARGSIPISIFLLAALVGIAGAAFGFANVHYSIFRGSRYPNEYYRVNRESFVGQVAERTLARAYLRQKEQDYQEVLEAQETSKQALAVAERDHELRRAIKEEVTSLLTSPLVPEKSDVPDPYELAEFVRALVLEQERLSRYYEVIPKGALSYSGKVMEEIVFQRIERSEILKKHDVNILMRIFLREISNRIGQKGDSQESSRIYRAFVFFSSMLFLTAGSADIIPNSDNPLVLLLLLVQFGVYVSIFVLLIPMSLNVTKPPRNQSSSFGENPWVD